MGTPTDVPDTAAAADVSIRTPLWGRVWAVGFGSVWVVLFLVFTSRGDDDAVVTRILLPAVAVLFAAAIVWRILVQGIRSDGDDLVVRGPFTTRRVSRSQVRDVTRGESGQFPGTPCVVVTTADHRSISAPPLATLPFGARATRETDDHVARVRSWAGLGD